MAVRLTKNLIEKTKTTDSLQIIYDSAVEGLHIELKPTGKRVWKVRVLKGEARDKKTKLGMFPDVSVEEARELAENWLSQFDSTMSKKLADRNKDFLNASFEDLINEHIRELCIEHEVDISDKVSLWRPRTIVQKRNTLHKLCKDLKKIHNIGADKALPMKLVTHEQLKVWHAENESLYSANRTLAYLAVMLRPFVKQGLLEENPAEGIKKNKEYERDLSLNRADLNVLLNALENVTNKVAGAALITIARTGQRPDEIITLARGDDGFQNYVDYESKEFVFRQMKTSRSSRTKEVRVGIPPKALETIKSQPVVDGNWFVFPGTGNTYVSYTALKNALNAAKEHVLENDLVKDKKTIKAMTPYVLRHTFATLAAIAGWSPADIAVHLKHKNIATTMKYIKKAKEYNARLALKADDLI